MICLKALDNVMLDTVVQAAKSGENNKQKLLGHTHLTNNRTSLMSNQTAVQLVTFSVYSPYFNSATKGISYPFPNGIIH